MAAERPNVAARIAAACVVLACGSASAGTAASTDPPRAVVAKPVRAEAGPKAAAPALGWHDGGGWRGLRVDPGREADLTPRAGGAPVVLRPAGATPKSADAQVSPVLLDDAGHERALPGGVLVVLHAPLDEATARAVIAAAGAVPSRRIGGSTWLVESPPGLASLELANRLHAGGRFASAQPNWWVRRALK